MSRKSNREICDLYMEKNRDEVTLKYFETWKVGKNAKNNPYLGLYEDFENFTDDLKNIVACENKDNVSLYRVLQAWKEPERASYPIEIFGEKDKKPIYLGEIADASQMPNLDFLKNIDIDILNPAKNPGGKANQKWHLYVSYFAYSVVCKNAFDWGNKFVMKNGQPPKCLILRLWMIENTEGQEDVLKKIEEAIDSFEDVEGIEDLINKTFEKIIEEHA